VLLALGVASIIAALVVSSLAVVDATEYGLVLRWGRLARVVDTPGLALVLPTDRLVRVDRRLHFFSPAPAEYLTVDKKNVVIQPLIAWRVSAPATYATVFTDRGPAEDALADVVLSEIGALVGRYPFAALASADATGAGQSEPLSRARAAIADRARTRFGVEVAELGLRQISLPEQNRRSVFERMKAERGRLAMRYRSEGDLEAKRIIAGADREKARIDAEAYAQAQRVRAEGDAEAARVYASAYGQDPGFYRFLRTLWAYDLIIDANTVLVLPATAAALGGWHGGAGAFPSAPPNGEARAATAPAAPVTPASPPLDLLLGGAPARSSIR
jgi:membrane protease subunit HflC